MTDTAAKPTARDRIIRAAERLYALHGIDAVSFRQINADAGQKNASAVNYHFGTREGLIEAILARATQAPNERRLSMLRTLKAGDHRPNYRQIAEALARPQFDRLARGRTTYDRRFIKQVHQRHALMDEVLTHRHDEGLRGCYSLLRHQPDAAPQAILRHRYIHANAIAIDAAATLEERIDTASSDLTDAAIALHVEACIDSIAGVFAAPVSAAALRLASPAPASD